MEALTKASDKKTFKDMVAGRYAHAEPPSPAACALPLLQQIYIGAPHHSMCLSHTPYTGGVHPCVCGMHAIPFMPCYS